MTQNSTTKSHETSPERCEPTVSRLQSAGLQNHPNRMEGLTRRMARCQEELRGMRREAIIALDDAILKLDTLGPNRRQGSADQLLAELEVALNEVGILDHDTLPRPEHFFAMADRLSRLNQMLPASSETTDDSGPTNAGDDRRPQPESPDPHNVAP